MYLSLLNVIYEWSLDEYVSKLQDLFQVPGSFAIRTFSFEYHDRHGCFGSNPDQFHPGPQLFLCKKENNICN